MAAWAVFAFSFTPLRNSHDEWWHLKTGQYIATHGLPEHDIFTYTAADMEWHNHEWLTQLLLWHTYQFGRATGFGGIRAVISLKTLFILAAFAGFGLLLARRMREPVWAALAVALMAALARRTFYPRPPFVSYLLLAVVLWMLIEWRAGRLRARWLAGCLPGFALWANLHGGWMAGLVILAAFWADAAARTAWGWLTEEGWWRPARSLTVLTALGFGCAAATLLNPYGVRLYELAGRVMSDPYLVESIGELQPPNWSFVYILEGTLLLLAALALGPVRWPAWMVTVVLLVVLHLVLRHFSLHTGGDSVNPWVHTALAVPILAGAVARARPPGALAHFLLVLFFTHQGLHHVRHLSLAAIMLLPTVALGLEGWSLAFRRALSTHPAWRRRLSPRIEGLLAPSVAALVLAALLGYWIFGTKERPTYWTRNAMLARGTALQPNMLDTRRRDLPVPSSLPGGRFWVRPYPEALADFLLRADVPARLFNGGNYAGYLMWRLAPEHYKLFTDNRYDIYGGRFLLQEQAVRFGWTEEQIQMAPGRYDLKQRGADLSRLMGWRRVLDTWNVQTVILEVAEPGNARLANAPDWVRVYEDLGFNVWIRNTKANQPAIERARNAPRMKPWLNILRRY